MKKAYLYLENGSCFEGKSPKWQEHHCEGEVVFTTGMVGYTESLTDPSFEGQLLTFTYPLQGNYGVETSQSWESTRIHPKGVIFGQMSSFWDHSQSMKSLLEWLKESNIPIIHDLDTRALTKEIRNQGVMKGKIVYSSRPSTTFSSLPKNPWEQVSLKKPTLFRDGFFKRIIAIDCGMKNSIHSLLEQFPCSIYKVPFDYDFTNEPYDGIFISNGPGDPSLCTETIEILKKALKLEKPIFGICFGAQLLALAAGASTYKLKYGHRGQNQPCIELETNRCFITSQNHGYAIDSETLPDNWEVSFKNLNDESIEGIAHKHLPYFAVQFHPEAAPGPTDTKWLFNKFFNLL
jgi:carbamoyl-phosphate synthase small subunit